MRAKGEPNRLLPESALLSVPLGLFFAFARPENQIEANRRVAPRLCYRPPYPEFGIPRYRPILVESGGPMNRPSLSLKACFRLLA